MKNFIRFALLSLLAFGVSADNINRVLPTAAIPALTGDVTKPSGSSVTTVAKIAGVTVSGTTGTVNAVLSNSPTLVTPALGTPSALVLTNATGTPTAAIGLANATGLPLTTGVTGILPAANGGTGVAAYRPPGVPAIISAQPANASIFWDDFYSNSIAPPNFGEGVVATPGTIVNQTLYGHPQWASSAINGTTGQVSNDNDASKFGNIRLVTGTTTNNEVGIGQGGQITAPQNYAFTWASTSVDSVGMWRVTRTATGASVGSEGWGWAHILADNVDFLVDPDTAFGVANDVAIIFYRNNASYGSGGCTQAAGDIWVRVYDGANAVQCLQMIASASVVSGTYHKYEVGSHAGVLTFYVDGTSKGTLTITGANSVGSGGRAIAQIINLGSNNRFLWLDCLYTEVGSATPR